MDKGQDWSGVWHWRPSLVLVNVVVLVVNVGVVALFVVTDHIDVNKC